MSEIPLRMPDNDLIPLLRKCDNSELDPLVGYITHKISSQLESTKAYKTHQPNHKGYVDEICAELQKYGGHTVTNIMRGGKGVLYKEIVCDVADKLKVNYNKKQDVDFIEMQILLKVLEKAWEKMSDEEKMDIMKDLGNKAKGGPIPKQFPLAALQVAIRAGGFKAFQIGLTIALRVAAAVTRLILGRGPQLASMALVAKVTTQGMKFIAGPIGWAITGLWSVYDLGAPAYRVTVPCIIHIAALRQLQVLKDKGDDLIAALAEDNQEKINAAWEKASQEEDGHDNQGILFRKF